MRLFPSAPRAHAFSRFGGGRVSTIEGAAIAEVVGIRLPIRGKLERVFRGPPDRLSPLSPWFRLHRSIVHASCGIFGIPSRPLQPVAAGSRRRIGKASPTGPRMLAERPVFARPQHWGDAAFFIVPWATQGHLWREPRQSGRRAGAGNGGNSRGGRRSGHFRNAIRRTGHASGDLAVPPQHWGSPEARNPSIFTGPGSV